MKKNVSLVGLLLVSVVLSGCSLLGVKGLNPDITVTGIVQDEVTGRGVEGVKVAITPGETVVTNSDGMWQTTKAKKGSKIELQKPGWEFEPRPSRVEKDNEAIVIIARQVRYQASGYIRSQTGEPIGQCRVSFELENGHVYETYSLSDGAFSQDNLVGTVTMRVEKDGWHFHNGTRLIDAGNCTDLEVVGTKETILYPVNGRTMDTQGNPIANTLVSFESNDGQVVATILSDNGGFFIKSGLTGEVSITPSKEGWVFTPEKAIVNGVTDSLIFTGKPSTYTASGLILDANGDPIEGVLVSFEDEEGHKSSVRSNAEGLFTKSGLQGEITVTPTKQGWRFEPEHYTINGGKSALSFIGYGLTYTVTGWVEDEDGNPIERAAINVWVDDTQVSSVISDEAGFFAIPNLTGEVTINAHKQGFEFAPSSYRLSGATEVVFSGKRQTYSVSGFVTSVHTKSGIGDVLIVFMNDEGDVAATARTDHDGCFEKSGLTGEVSITPSKEGWVFTPEKAIVNGVTDSLIFTGKPSTYTASGLILDANGDPIEGVLVSFEDEEGHKSSVRSNAEGLFTKSGLQGEITVTPTKQGWRFEPEHYTINGGKSALSFIGYGLTYTVTGWVEDEDGNPIERAAINVWVDDTQVSSVISDEAGFFAIPNLTGEVTINAHKQGFEFAPSSYRLSGATEVVFSGKRQTYSVSGFVTSVHTKSGIGDVLIVFMNDEGDVAATARTDHDGCFEKSGLTGGYYVTAQKDGWSFAPDSILVTSATDSINFYGAYVQESYGASGRITYDDGNPVPAVVVTFTFLDSDRLDVYTTTDKNGTWSFEGLVGRVRVIPTKPGHVFTPGSQEIEGETINLNFWARTE